MFDWDESYKAKLRQWQYILELETYISDVGGISNGFSGACHMWRTLLGESGIHFGWVNDVRRKRRKNVKELRCIKVMVAYFIENLIENRVIV